MAEETDYPVKNVNRNNEAVIDYAIPILVERAVKSAADLNTALFNVEKVDIWVKKMTKESNG